MQVKLVAYTPEPERTAAAAARLCYSDISATALLDELTPQQVDRLISMVIENGHLSTIEHVSFTFAIDGLSRASSHQLVRHRLASFSQQSQRYVALRDAEFVTPPSIAARPDLLEKYLHAVKDLNAIYEEFLKAGIKAEDARYILPNATATRLVMTMNARELMHVSGLRLCRRSQWEIRQLFTKVKAEVAAVAPGIAKHLEPKCIRLGYCDEHETCGLKPLRSEVEGLQ